VYVYRLEAQTESSDDRELTLALPTSITKITYLFVNHQLALYPMIMRWEVLFLLKNFGLLWWFTPIFPTSWKVEIVLQLQASLGKTLAMPYFKEQAVYGGVCLQSQLCRKGR
jgi:hypothetical protein